MALAAILAGTLLLPVAAAVGGVAAMKYSQSDEPYDPNKYSRHAALLSAQHPGQHTRLLDEGVETQPKSLTPQQLKMLQHQLYLKQQQDLHQQSHTVGTQQHQPQHRMEEVPCGAVLRTHPVTNDPTFAPEYPPGYNVPGSSYGPVTEPTHMRAFRSLPGTNFVGGVMPDSEEYKKAEREEFMRGHVYDGTTTDDDGNSFHMFKKRQAPKNVFGVEFSDTESTPVQVEMERSLTHRSKSGYGVNMADDGLTQQELTDELEGMQFVNKPGLRKFKHLSDHHAFLIGPADGQSIMYDFTNRVPSDFSLVDGGVPALNANIHNIAQGGLSQVRSTHPMAKATKVPTSTEPGTKVPVQSHTIQRYNHDFKHPNNEIVFADAIIHDNVVPLKDINDSQPAATTRKTKISTTLQAPMPGINHVTNTTASTIRSLGDAVRRNPYDDADYAEFGMPTQTYNTRTSERMNHQNHQPLTNDTGGIRWSAPSNMGVVEDNRPENVVYRDTRDGLEFEEYKPRDLIIVGGTTDTLGHKSRAVANDYEVSPTAFGAITFTDQVLAL
jgi:hypothetical protein